jgi:hypothetical protein
MKTRYTVKYRINKPFSRWHTLKKVIGDGFIDDKPIRFFRLEDETMVYIPEDAEVNFSPERHQSIVQSMSKEAGTQIVTD